MRGRQAIQVQMEMLASLFASPKVITRLCQSCNVNVARAQEYIGPLLSKGLVRTETVGAQEMYVITEEGYSLYKDWLEVWRRLSP